MDANSQVEAFLQLPSTEGRSVGLAVNIGHHQLKLTKGNKKVWLDVSVDGVEAPRRITGAKNIRAECTRLASEVDAGGSHAASEAQPVQKKQRVLPTPPQPSQPASSGRRYRRPPGRAPKDMRGVAKIWCLQTGEWLVDKGDANDANASAALPSMTVPAASLSTTTAQPPGGHEARQQPANSVISSPDSADGMAGALIIHAQEVTGEVVTDHTIASVHAADTAGANSAVSATSQGEAMSAVMDPRYMDPHYCTSHRAEFSEEVAAPPRVYPTRTRTSGGAVEAPPPAPRLCAPQASSATPPTGGAFEAPVPVRRLPAPPLAPMAPPGVAPAPTHAPPISMSGILAAELVVASAATMHDQGASAGAASSTLSSQVHVPATDNGAGALDRDEDRSEVDRAAPAAPTFFDTAELLFKHRGIIGKLEYMAQPDNIRPSVSQNDFMAFYNKFKSDNPHLTDAELTWQAYSKYRINPAIDQHSRNLAWLAKERRDQIESGMKTLREAICAGAGFVHGMDKVLSDAPTPTDEHAEAAAWQLGAHAAHPD